MKYFQSNLQLASMLYYVSPLSISVLTKWQHITIVTSCHVNCDAHGDPYVYYQFLASFSLWKIMYPNI